MVMRQPRDDDSVTNEELVRCFQMGDPEAFGVL